MALDHTEDPFVKRGELSEREQRWAAKFAKTRVVLVRSRPAANDTHRPEPSSVRERAR